MSRLARVHHPSLAASRATVAPIRGKKLPSPPLGRGRAMPHSCTTRLLALSHWAPGQVVTTRELTDELSHRGHPLPFDLGAKTGVREHRRVPAEMDVVDLALESARPALATSGVAASDIDLVIYTSVTRQYLEPATAVVVAHRLGIETSFAFDLSNACIGFMDGLLIADAMITLGRAQRALVVAAEIGSTYVDAAMRAIGDGEPFYEHFAALTLGDGSAAAVVGPDHGYGNGPRLVCSIRETFSEHHDLCVIEGSGAPMATQPKKLFEAALDRMPQLFDAALEYANWRPRDVDLAVPHQASLPIIEAGGALIGIPRDRTQVSMERYGNTASVALPFALSEALDQGRIGAGAQIVTIGFGSGLGVGVQCLEL